MSEERKCKICDAPERLIEHGLYSTLSPFGEVCVDCVNKELEKLNEEDRRPKTIE